MRRDISLIALAMFIWGIGEGMFIYFQSIYMAQMGANPEKIGIILSAAGFVFTIVHIPAGYFADRIGRKPLLLASWILGVVAIGVQAAAKNLPLLVVGILLYGFTAFVSSPLSSYLTAARGKLSVGRILTLISAFYNLGGVIGSIMGGWIGDKYGLNKNYLVAFVIVSISSILMFFIQSQPIERHSPIEKSSGSFLKPIYLAYLGVIFLAGFAMVLAQPLTPIFLSEQRGLSVEIIGRLYAMSSIGMVILSLALGQLPARVGYLVSQLAVGLFTLIIWKGTGLPWIAVGLCFLGGYRTARSLAAAQSRELVPPGKMGVAYGITETIGGSAFVLAPLLAGVLYTRNPVQVYIVAGILIMSTLIITLLFYVWHPQKPKVITNNQT
jgi:MFS family permease